MAEQVLDRATRPAAEQPAEPMNLFSEEEAHGFQTRWNDIQAAFVDDPKRAVEHADGLVSDVTSRLTDSFARTRADLDAQWKRGDNVSTEELRVALQRYRGFFGRLLQM